MQHRMGRRGFLKASAAGATMVMLGSALSGCSGGSFVHGVASGDPRRDAVVIWTRVTPSADAEVSVVWEVAHDAAFQRLVAGGMLTTDASVDYTIKVDVCDLRPGQSYYYRFLSSDSISPVGRTRTLPTGAVDQFTLAVVSCAHYSQGYFHVYRELSRRDDLDLVLHLGDYIYESGNGATGVRSVLPRSRAAGSEQLSPALRLSSCRSRRPSRARPAPVHAGLGRS